MHPSPFLAFLDSPDGTAFLADFRVREVARGEVVSRPGDASDCVFVVRSGRLRVWLASETRELTLVFLEAGDVFSTHTPTWVTAVQPSALALIETRRFSARMAGQSPATVAVMRVLGMLLARTVELVEHLVFREAHERLASFLATLARRQGRREPTGRATGEAMSAGPSAAVDAGAGEGAATRNGAAPEVWSVALPFTLTDIALMLGASRQTISTAFADLERAGIVERRGRRELRILDLARLDARNPPQLSPARQTGPRHPT
ncbi:Crp/Fnr family transcriptional regulator [Derxia gummosa]|uniref:Crp/Fnr family transcriptional regulator n=1 Tax=Derxia gummosa DSM 723 TaxID=1121388 RepID=A0A8B6XAB6_9BURK|nr:Crp/Fnr family transcriptional regulator [Derxia gummosa]